MIEPQIHFELEDVEGWTKKSLADLFKEMEELRTKVQEAAGYRLNVQNFYIDTADSRPVLALHFSKDLVVFWSVRTKKPVLTLDKLGKDEFKTIKKLVTEGA